MPENRNVSATRQALLSALLSGLLLTLSNPVAADDCPEGNQRCRAAQERAQAQQQEANTQGQQSKQQAAQGQMGGAARWDPDAEDKGHTEDQQDPDE